MKKKIIKLSILTVTLCAVLFTTFVPALADSAHDGSSRPLARYISENGALVQSGLNGWERTGSAFRFVGADVSSADMLEIGLPHDYKGGYMTTLSIFGSISASGVDAPAFSVSYYDKMVLYVNDHRVYAMNIEGEFAEICSFTLNIHFKFFISSIDGVDAIAYYIQPDDSDLIYGLSPLDLLSDAEGMACVYIHPSVDHRGYIGVTNVVVSEMDYMDSSLAFNGISNSAILSNMDLLLSESYNNGYTDGYDVGYGDGFDDGEAQGGGGNTDGSYDEGYAAGKTDGYNDGYDVGWESGREDGYGEGYAQGKTEGQVIGQDIGYTAGLAAGKELGYADGKADGLAEVEQKEEAAYNNGFTAGKTEGKTEGYADGKADGLADLEKQKTDAYNNGYNVGFGWGEDYGYEQGYGDGYDVGRQDGIETGAQTGYDSGYYEGYEDGYDVGRQDGIETGAQTGYDSGYFAGYEKGEEVGYLNGIADLDEKCEEAYSEGLAAGEITGWDDGYLAGESVGISKGKVIGHDEGYALGYNKGDVDGYNRGIEQTNFLFDAVNGTWHGVVEAYSTLADGITLFNVSLGEVVATAGLFMLVTFIVKAVRGA